MNEKKRKIRIVMAAVVDIMRETTYNFLTPDSVVFFHGASSGSYGSGP